MTAIATVSADALGRRLANARRAWWALAPITGLMLTGSAAYELYFAYVSYVLEHTGTTRNTGAESSLVGFILSFDGVFILLVYLAELMSLLAWLRYVWLSLVLVDRLQPGLRRHSPLVTLAGFFVPVASFWIQVRAMNDIGRVADVSRNRPPRISPALPAAITLLFFVALQFSRVVDAVPATTFSDTNDVQQAMLLSSSADIAAFAILLLCDGFMLSVLKGQLRGIAKLKRAPAEADA